MSKTAASFILLCLIFGKYGLAQAATIEPRGPEVNPPVVAAPNQAQAPQAASEKPSQHSAEVQVKPQNPEPPQASSTSDKLIVVTLKDQDLKYFEGTTLIGEFKISSGLPGTPSPPGEYTILEKKPVVDYKGPNYDFPNTKWNLLFKHGDPLGYYIHGAYWHHNFGHPMSHGCINVSYANMEPLYNWADVGTKVVIEQD